MSIESPNTNWREWKSDTTDRGGRERGLGAYEGYLGFNKEELAGKRILEIGSGETEKFSRELKAANIDAQVIALNPDYSQVKHRKKINEVSDWNRKSVAATGQELPFQDESFDKILALFSLTVFASPSKLGGNPEAAQRWVAEIARVLKHGGEARIAPTGWFKNIQEAEESDYKPFVEWLRVQGLEVKFEEIKNKDLGYTIRHSFRIDETGQQHDDLEDVSESMHDWRIVIKKP